MRTYGGGFIQAFSLFVPKPVDPELIPPGIREAVLAGNPGRDLRCYAAGPTTGGAFTAIDFKTDDPPGRFLRLTLWGEGAFSSGTPLARLAEVTVPLRFDRPFGHSALGKVAEDEGQPVEAPPAGPETGTVPDAPRGLRAAAGGWAWDARVVAVAGTTLEGEEVRAKTVNGCWLLVAGGAEAAGWREFRALDHRNKVMYGKEV